MNLKTAAATLSVHYQTAYKLVRSGALAAVKIGGTYEISEAAIERYKAEREALRAGAAVPRDTTVVAAHRDRDEALAEVQAVAACTTTCAKAAFDTVARVGAEVIGDTGVVYRVTETGFESVAYHIVDPKRRGVVAAMRNAFDTARPHGYLPRIVASQQPLLLSHVPQDRLRSGVDPQHRQFLDIVGVHSLVGAPVIVDGAVEAIVVMSRATPGAPYGAEELEFAEALAEGLRVAMQRAALYTAGWNRRRELVKRVGESFRKTHSAEAAERFLHNDGFIEVVSDLNGTVVANNASEKLTDVERALILNENSGRFAAGDLEFYDEEREITGPEGEAIHLVVHRGLVRDEVAHTTALVVVAQRLEAFN
jgi:excisionase family DNA binding protein